MKLALGCLTLLCAVRPCGAQAVEFTDFLAGRSAPHTLQLKDLTADWRRLVIDGVPGTQEKGLGDILGPLMQAGMASGKGKGPGDAAGAAAGMMIMSSLFGGGGGQSGPVYYTKGQLLSMAGETFIVAYKVKKQQPNLMALAAQAGADGDAAPDASALGGKLAGDSILVLSLVNFKSVSGISDVRPFDLKREIEESASSGGLMDLLSLGGANNAVLAPPVTQTTKPVQKPSPRKKPN